MTRAGCGFVLVRAECQDVIFERGYANAKTLEEFRSF
jgi:hypothetical protein